MNEEEKRKYEAFQYWIQTNTERGVTTIPDNLCLFVVNLIKSLQKENEKLRAKWDKDTHILQNKLDYANADRIDLTQQNKELRKENEELKKDYYNVINKIENKIDILDIAISGCIYIDDDDKAYKKAVKKDKLCLLNQKRALQELLEEGDLE